MPHQGVVIFGKCVDGSKDVLEVNLVVGRMRILAVEGVLGSVDIKDEIDASVGKSLHALIVLDGVVDTVDTDGVDAQLLELLDVTLAGLRLGDGILQLGFSTLLCC